MEVKILIVDDQPANLELLEALLVPQGYILIKAASGEAALEQLLSVEPDLILLDVMMPGISGFSVLEEIRKNDKTKIIPVIMLTALSDRESRLKGIEAGADDFISKPFDKAELISKVKTQVKLSLLRRQIDKKEQLADVLDLMLEGVAITDDDMNIKQINNTAMELLGLTKTALNLGEILQSKYGRKIDKQLDKGAFIISRPESASFKPLYLMVEYKRTVKLHKDKGSYVFIFKNVTDEYAKTKIKEDFMSLISHKLRTPLTVIVGYAKMLGVLAPDEKLKDATTAIARHSIIIENLIKRILYFVEIENACKQNTLNPVDLRELAGRYALIYKKEFELSSVKDILQVSSWQKTVLEELIENSFKFSDKEKVMLGILAAEQSISVEDNGPGIPVEERGKVFEPFYQVYKNFTGNTTGAGLGLSIVKRLVESAGQVVSLENAAAGGLKVTVISKS